MSWREAISAAQKKLEKRDAQGEMRATLWLVPDWLLPDGGPGLVLLDAQGKVRAAETLKALALEAVPARA